MKQFSEIKTELINLSLPIGVIIATAYPEYNILFTNNKFCEMLGFADENELFDSIHKSAWDCIYEKDIDEMRKLAAKRNGESELYEVAYRAVKKDGTLIWVNQCSQHVIDENDVELVYAYYTDITAQKQAEQVLRESEFRYAAAVKSSNINIWEYDYQTDSMTIFSKSPKVNPKNMVIQNYTKVVVSEEHIREDCAPILFDMIEKLKKGVPEMIADLWIRENKNDDFWCEHVSYTNIFDDLGNPIKAYCVGRDITKEKEAEKRYLDERSYREAMQKATMASINVNLTQNIILDYKSVFTEITAFMKASKTVQDYFDHVYTELATEKMQKQWAMVFNRESLLRNFANGKTTLSMELTRKIAKRRYWTIMTVHMMKKAENNDVVAFLYSTNVTNERTMQNVMNAIVKTDYDFLVVIDAIRNSAVRYSEKDLGKAYSYESENFEKETLEYVNHYICSDDMAHVSQEITLNNIIAQLEAHGSYNIFYSIPKSDKTGKLKKQLRFCYINRELKSILMTRVDITAAVEEQEKRNMELVAAVCMAEQANTAKSEFLSRISHEIRTPMNAIMGMGQLASHHLDDKEFVSDCIEKSQYASKYLLQLLNDILDMSKIESGKVLLKEDVIHCQRFLNAINTIIQTQASASGVHYVVTQFSDCKNSYLGDEVRLQQILINILSNAVKFTAKGGTVHLDISQVNKNEKNVIICFTVSDTGIGISEAFLSNIFKPFSQEHSGTKSGYGGSGLGLAISQNLAKLMGGDISVESVLGKGTTFRVQIPFDIPTSADNENAENVDFEQCETYDFCGKRFLLVEDHQLNIIVAKKLLEFKNAVVDVAENGKIGYTLFANAPEHTYDAVLMDIRMPVMDGLQSAKCIRSLDSAWAKEVPIIAMSANAFDDDVIKSQLAGMNAHIAKPIDANLLYKTIHRFLKN